MAALAFPKPEPLRRVRARRRRTKGEWIAFIRGIVFGRDHGCRVCQRGGGLLDEMHEIRPRSLTRGRPLAERFSRENCCRVCPACHEDLTRHRIDLVPVDATRGAEARLLVQPHLPIRHVDYRPAPTLALPVGAHAVKNPTVARQRP